MSVLVDEARLVAERFVRPLGRRWRHVQGVGARAAELARTLPVEERDVVVAAAWLHDIGYAPEIAHTGFHPLDGARYLQEVGWPEQVVNLVAHHSGARIEGYLRGLQDEHAAFTFEATQLDDILAAADLTTGPGGESFTFAERLAEIRQRYPLGSIVRNTWQVAEPIMQSAVTRVESITAGRNTPEAADRKRAAMVETLTDRWGITSPALRAALRKVPREAFVPTGTPLSQTYDPDVAITTRWTVQGIPISSVSAPWLQARMIAQAEVGPGDRVLEIGSGGYNAALLAEVVEDTGSVVSVDIDPWVTGRARRYLAAAGYDRVEVITTDAELALPEQDLFDAIVVTVGAWDIAPAWIDQLAPGGRLVVPLDLRLNTRSLGLRRDGDHLVATSSDVCGFVAMQGLGRREFSELHAVDPLGVAVSLTYDGEIPFGQADLEGFLRHERVEAWSGVPAAKEEDLSGLLLWLASHDQAACRVDAASGGVVRPEGSPGWSSSGLLGPSSLTRLTSRKVGEAYEIGALGFGEGSSALATRLITHVRRWHAAGRPAAPDIRYWPNRAQPVGNSEGLLIPKRHGAVEISWPQLDAG